MKLIKEMDRATRTLDPVEKALAEIYDGDEKGSDFGRPSDEDIVQRLASHWGGEMGQSMDDTTLREHIGMDLENIPGYKYGEDAEQLINRVMQAIGRT